MVQVHAQRRREPLRSPSTHCLTTLIGQTTSVGPSPSPPGSSRSDASIAIAWTVLPEAHVVGQDPADTEVAEHPQPAVAALLEREQRELHRGGRRQRPEALVAVLEQLGERRVEGHLAELEPGFVSLEARLTARTSSTMPAPLRRRSRKRSAFSTSERRSACQRPATRTNGSFAAARSASSCSLRTTSPIDEAPVEAWPARPSTSSPLERVATPVLVAVRLTRSLLVAPQPGPRKQHRHAARLEQRHRLAQEEPDLVVVELHLGGLGAVEADAVLGEQRLDLGQAAGRGPGADRSRGGSGRPRRPARAGARPAARASGRPRHAARARARAPPSPRSSRWRPSFHGAAERRPRPSSTQRDSRRLSAA